MRTRSLTAAAATLGAAATFLIPAAASAATTTYPHFTGYAGGTYAYALNGTVLSGMTAASSIDTVTAGRTNSNNVAQASALGIIGTGVVTTSVSSASVPGGVAITSHARTAGINLLGGLITADAVDTTATATVASKVTSTINTKLVNLSINHKAIPIQVAPNTTISIPGIARVVVNYTKSAPGLKAMSTNAAAVLITLLTKSGSVPAGAVIQLNPVGASIAQVGPGYAPLGGIAYGTSVSANVGSALGLSSGATGAVMMPTGGTRGQDISNPTLAVNLQKVATLGAVHSTANGVVSNTGSHGTLKANIANVNLLGGAVTADALTATATVSKTGASAPVVGTGNATFVNLKVLGIVVPANAPANTVVKLGNVGTVTVNGQYYGAGYALVQALAIHLTTAAYGLPANATVIVGAAQAYFQP